MFMVRLDPIILSGIDFDKLDQRIRARVPMGGEVHSSPRINMKGDFPWTKIQKDASEFTAAFNKRYGSEYRCPKIDLDWFLSLCERVSIRKKKKDFAQYVINSIGTLGGGK
jgi:hypothetical protein